MKPFGTVDELVDFAVTARGEFGFVAEMLGQWITNGRIRKAKLVYAVVHEGLVVETVKTEYRTVLVQ